MVPPRSDDRRATGRAPSPDTSGNAGRDNCCKRRGLCRSRRTLPRPFKNTRKSAVCAWRARERHTREQTACLYLVHPAGPGRRLGSEGGNAGVDLVPAQSQTSPARRLWQKATRTLVASGCPRQLALAASASTSTSPGVRCSRVRSSAFGRRVGVAVRFSSLATNLRGDFATPDGKTAIYITDTRNRVSCDAWGGRTLTKLRKALGSLHKMLAG
jgi:hypothetical protein